MKTIKIKFEYKNTKHVLEAHLADNLCSIINDEGNQATDIIDGIGDDLGIWSLYFGRHGVQADFICNVDDKGTEDKTLQPIEILLIDENKGSYLNTSRISFAVEPVE